jgi:hypothetical protein
LSLKLFEYFALEKPMGGTSDLFDCVAFREVFRGDSVEALSDALNRALAVRDDPESIARIAVLVDQSDWDERARTMEGVFSGQVQSDE